MLTRLLKSKSQICETFHLSSPSAPCPSKGHSQDVLNSTQRSVDIEDKLKEIEDKIRLDIEDRGDKADKNSSDYKKHLQAVLRRIGESVAVKA